MEPSRFIEKDLARNFLCVICQGIAWEPVKHANCSAIYCKKCTTNNEEIKCIIPYCKNKTQPLKDQLEELNQLESNIYNELNIPCRFCDQKMKVGTIKQHYTTFKSWPIEIPKPTKEDKETKGGQVVSSPYQPSYLRPYRQVQIVSNGNKLQTIKIGRQENLEYI